MFSICFCGGCFLPSIPLEMVVIITDWETAREYFVEKRNNACWKSGQVTKNCPSAVSVMQKDPLTPINYFSGVISGGACY
jgi:hypothetical protein